MVRTSVMVGQLAEAMEHAGVAAQPRVANYSLLVERQAADATGQPMAGQVRTHPIQRASDQIRELVDGPRVCDACLH
eukprot:14760774-Alexandrium_andersonii.AAC.1